MASTLEARHRQVERPKWEGLPSAGMIQTSGCLMLHDIAFGQSKSKHRDSMTETRRILFPSIDDLPCSLYFSYMFCVFFSSVAITVL